MQEGHISMDLSLSNDAHQKHDLHNRKFFLKVVFCCSMYGFFFNIISYIVFMSISSSSWSESNFSYVSPNLNLCWVAFDFRKMDKVTSKFCILFFRYHRQMLAYFNTSSLNLAVFSKRPFIAKYNMPKNFRVSSLSNTAITHQHIVVCNINLVCTVSHCTTRILEVIISNSCCSIEHLQHICF